MSNFLRRENTNNHLFRAIDERSPFISEYRHENSYYATYNDIMTPKAKQLITHNL